MDFLLIATYTAICVAIFKIFRIPLNKWTVPTAVLGGVVLIGTLMMLPSTDGLRPRSADCIAAAMADAMMVDPSPRRVERAMQRSSHAVFKLYAGEAGADEALASVGAEEAFHDIQRGIIVRIVRSRPVKASGMA